MTALTDYGAENSNESSDLVRVDTQFVRNPSSGTIHECFPSAATGEDYYDHALCGSFKPSTGDGLAADSRGELTERFGEDALCGICFEQAEGGA